MTAPHFFADDVSGGTVTLTPEDSKHALRVLRLRAGERITVADGTGSVVEATVGADAGRLVAHVTARRSEERPSPLVHVFQAIPKKGKLDLVVQKLTELGVASVRPFAAERSIPRWDPSKGEAHSARLREVARQAAMQSRGAWIPEVPAPVPLDALELPGAAIVLHESATRRLSEALPEAAPGAVSIVVGPEGGLTDEEVTALRERDAQPVTLGPSILRTETAALATVAIVLARYGRLG